LLKGFALYCQRGGEGELRLPRKGQDFQAAVDLIAELAIAERVHWLDEMPLVRFYDEMVAADVVCDQFGSSYPGMVTTDAYALGRPVMAKLRPEIFSQRFPEALPGFNAETPEQIADHLMTMERNRNVLADMGIKSRAYAETYLSPEAMAKQFLDKL
jgi:glycosyltransferase involved in cell wall biosynthesis